MDLETILMKPICSAISPDNMANSWLKNLWMLVRGIIFSRRDYILQDTDNRMSYLEQISRKGRTGVSIKVPRLAELASSSTIEFLTLDVLPAKTSGRVEMC
jgi:hypothetical protein